LASRISSSGSVIRTVVNRIPRDDLMRHGFG
jgi:hypothetical protein